MTDAAGMEISDVHNGFSDEKLEALSQVHSKFETGMAPWASHESESSSFGKTFRAWAHFPNFLPLYICSDHGVHWESKCWPNETQSPYKVYFTWNKKKNDLMKRVHQKKSCHVPHPWVFYRKKYFKLPQTQRRGTLVYFPHSNDTTSPVFDDLDRYINGLKSLPDKYQPVVICLSYADVEKGEHKKLRKYNIPLVTAGAMRSQDFVNRFYSLLGNFRFSSSANIGSHTYYAIEAGVSFLLYGEYPEYLIKGSIAVPDGRLNLQDYGDNDDIAEFTRMKILFSAENDQVTTEQYAIVSKYLGLDSGMTRWKASLILWRELFLHLDELVWVYIRRIVGVILRLILPAKWYSKIQACTYIYGK